MKTEYTFISANKILELILNLGKKINDKYKPDCLVGISRGGLWVVRNLSDFLSVPEVYVIRIVYYKGVKSTNKRPEMVQDIDKSFISGKKVLLVDDVADTGESLIFAIDSIKQKGAEEIKTATLHYKPWSKAKPDFYIEETSKWIVYPWEIREIVELIMKKENMAENERMEELDKTGIPKNLIKEFLEVIK